MRGVLYLAGSLVRLTQDDEVALCDEVSSLYPVNAPPFLHSLLLFQWIEPGPVIGSGNPWMVQACQLIHKKEQGKKLAGGDLEEILIAGKWEQTGSDSAEAEASDVHGVSYLKRSN